MTTRREHLSKADAIIVAVVETAVPALATARDLLDRFHRLFRARDMKALSPWMVETERSLLGAFARGIKADLAAVQAAFSERWSNGQTEGQITKLKLVKHQMYGRAGLVLLRHASSCPHDPKRRPAPSLSQSPFCALIDMHPAPSSPLPP